MKSPQTHFWPISLLTLLALASVSLAQEPVPLPARDATAIEVQTRGPLHDAIAQPFGVKPEAGPLVPKEPPAPIPEEPPAQKPDMENVQWVPGYWAWDSPRQEFMWISGVYRVPPQDRTYVPGYWSNTPDGWRWIAGFWSNARQQEVPYTPEPPAPLDANGPTLPAPDQNSLYVPGTWMWQTDRFIWRPGYWSAAQEGRVWVPPHYLWTPNGYAYVDGYWDYPLEDRGMMFAPAYFGSPLWTDPNWRYQPSYVLGANNFFDSAFVFGGGYYFGNYYGPNYARAGYNPWYSGRGQYDPMFAYQGWKTQRNNPNWIAGVQQTYAGRSAGRLAGPPLTLARQGATPVVTPLNQFASKKIQLIHTTPAQIATQHAAIQHTRQLAINRQQLEAPGASKTIRGNETRSLRLTTLANAKVTSGPQIINLDPGLRTTNNPGSTTLPKITNEPRYYIPSSGPKIVNAPTHVEPRTIITPNAGAKVLTPHPATKIVTPQATPHVFTPAAPRIVTPQAAPRVFTPAAPKIVTPAPRIVTPAPAIRKAAITAPANHVIKSAPVQRSFTAPAAPVRIQTPAPARIQAPVRAPSPPAHKAAAPVHRR